MLRNQGYLIKYFSLIDPQWVKLSWPDGKFSVFVMHSFGEA